MYFYVYIDDRRPRGGARRARSTGRDADDEWMSERSNDRSIDRWGDREVEGVSSIVES